MPAAPYCYVPEETPFLEGSTLKTKSVYFDAEVGTTSFTNIYNDVFDGEISESSQTNTSNPYQDSSDFNDIACDYLIPTPDVITSSSRYNVPPPREEVNEKFKYTLRNGTVLELDHPLPSCLPIEILSENHDQQSNEEPSESYDKLLYTLASIIPFAGYISSIVLRKNRPKMSRRLRLIGHANIVIIGTLLFICLL